MCPFGPFCAMFGVSRISIRSRLLCAGFVGGQNVAGAGEGAAGSGSSPAVAGSGAGGSGSRPAVVGSAAAGSAGAGAPSGAGAGGVSVSAMSARETRGRGGA